jgi:enolase
MAKIKQVLARQLIDCKCRPMVEAEIITDDGWSGRGAAPTGSSVGQYEAAVIRDNDPGEYDGLSVHGAVENVRNIIGPALVGMDVNDQRAVDMRMIELDGTENKGRLGGNVIYSVSIACVRAAAAAQRMPVYRMFAGRDVETVPVPAFNILNGGRYSDVILAFNEHLIVPYKAKSIDEAVEIGVKCLASLGKVIEKFLKVEPVVGRSYGWAAPTRDPAEALSLLREAAEICGYGDKVAFALDCASSEMYDAESKTYFLKDRRVTAAELIDYVRELSEKFPLVFVEDILDENDWENYPKAVERIPHTLIIGDDLTVTNLAKLRRAVESKAIHGFVLKPNQVGTITEALDANAYAKEHGLISIPSGRAGGVVDDIVMDFSVGLEAPIQKNGAPRSGERIDKLNFLMRACGTNPGCVMSNIKDLVRF